MKLKLTRKESEILTKFLGNLTDDDVKSVMHNKVENDYTVKAINKGLDRIYRKLKLDVFPIDIEVM